MEKEKNSCTSCQEKTVHSHIKNMHSVFLYCQFCLHHEDLTDLGGYVLKE